MTADIDEDMGTGILSHCLWECKLLQSFWKSLWKFLKMFKINLLQDPALPFLAMYPEDFVAYYRDTWSSMFIDVLFTVRSKVGPQKWQCK